VADIDVPAAHGIVAAREKNSMVLPRARRESYHTCPIELGNTQHARPGGRVNFMMILKRIGGRMMHSYFTEMLGNPRDMENQERKGLTTETKRH